MDMDATALSNLGGVGVLPGLNLQFVMESLATVFLASLRVGAFLIASPFFGGTSVPLQPRIIMAVLLGVAVVSNITVPSWQNFDAMTGFLVILTELAIGIGAGLILTIWFSSALLAGEKIAASSGLGFAAQIDPDSGGQTPVVSKIFSIFLTVLFLSWNGHLVVLRAILDTYQFMPVGTLPINVFCGSDYYVADYWVFSGDQSGGGCDFTFVTADEPICCRLSDQHDCNFCIALYVGRCAGAFIDRIITNRC
jgi:flagellar biosynthetic protein FliR